jgi:hypothetical protein
MHPVNTDEVPSESDNIETHEVKVVQNNYHHGPQGLQHLRADTFGSHGSIGIEHGVQSLIVSAPNVDAMPMMSS